MIKMSEYMKRTQEERQSHLNLSEKCELRGGDSIQFRGLLAYYVDTEIPSGHKITMCHACNNPDCSNPKHLYWGTPSENFEDRKLLEQQYSDFITKISISMSGENNPNFKLPPWRNINGCQNSWKKAGEIFNKYVKSDWDFSKHGHGPSYLQKKYNIAQGSSKVMIKKFNKGWNPFLDEDWLDFINN